MLSGFARLSDVEFYHTGQEGWTDDYDPRFSLAYVDVGEVTDVKPSYVKGCTFNEGYSSAIGVYGTNGLVVEDNVVYRPLSTGTEILFIYIIIHFPDASNRLVETSYI